MAVEYKRLGNHGTIVSYLCLGTVNFGTVTSEKDSFAIMDRALELGINFFETADVMAVNSALELWRSFWVVGLPKVAEGVTQ